VLTALGLTASGDAVDQGHDAGREAPRHRHDEVAGHRRDRPGDDEGLGPLQDEIVPQAEVEPVTINVTMATIIDDMVAARMKRTLPWDDLPSIAFPERRIFCTPQRFDPKG
jgi:hypothetical protein